MVPKNMISAAVPDAEKKPSKTKLLETRIFSVSQSFFFSIAELKNALDLTTPVPK